MPAIRGTASVADSRVRDKELKSRQFPAAFKEKVDLKKVNYPVLTMWIEGEYCVFKKLIKTSNI